jgi:hypothetical protein
MQGWRRQRWQGRRNRIVDDDGREEGIGQWKEEYWGRREEVE